MKKSFNKKLIDLLKTDLRFVDDEGELIKAAVIDRAWKIDRDLVKLLLSEQEIEKKFFDEIEEHWIFNINTFIEYISDKNFLANSYTRFRNKVGLNIGGKFLRERGEVSLVWPYKDCVLEGGQTKEEEKRKEIFFNEILAQDEIDRLFDPKVLTNFKRYTPDGKQKVTDIKRDEDGTIKENLIIKGNNLLALHTLKTQFRGKVDLIYIDPPYNPPSNANTFCYNNNFNHSSWLTFMKNRLDIAKNLLTNDGVLIVAIDENEHIYLGVLLDEIFPNHEKHCITIVHNPRGVQGSNFSYTHEYAYFIIPRGKKMINDRMIAKKDIKWSNLRNWGGESLRSDAKNCFYSIVVNLNTKEIIEFGNVCPDAFIPDSANIKRDNLIEIYPIDNDGVERKWRYARQSVDEVKHLLRARKKGDVWGIEIGKDFGVYKSVWIDTRYDANEYGTKIVKELVPDCNFDFPKSLYNVYDCLYAVVANKKDAIILDFFAGSGTTAHAVLNLNKEDSGDRRFIICEQMEYVDTVTKKRVKKVIEINNAGDFIYCELMKYNEAFMDKIQSAKTSDELLKIWKDIAENSFLNWYVNPEMPEEAVNNFMEIGRFENGLEKQKKLLAELLNKNQLYVNLSEIDDEDFKVSEEDKKLNQSFYGEAYNG
ncbi:site-specific DNA-methyltransferase [Candidatus Atribacteria bacterium MT.SAG.1]|nr:site-specific DNA-methyltransferase [Candidatus Atribacteria bacterium MT.SAG.1]